MIPDKRISVLLVEDNDDDRFLTMRLLKKLPLTLEIAIARNGDEALRLLLGEGAATPGLVLLDLQLPKIGGVHLLTTVRKKFTAAELPVIVLSSSDNPVDIRLCQELGISGYLSKPLNPEALLAMMERAFPCLDRIASRG